MEYRTQSYLFASSVEDLLAAKPRVTIESRFMVLHSLQGKVCSPLHFEFHKSERGIHWNRDNSAVVLLHHMIESVSCYRCAIHGLAFLATKSLLASQEYFLMKSNDAGL